MMTHKKKFKKNFLAFKLKPDDTNSPEKLLKPFIYIFIYLFRYLLHVIKTGFSSNDCVCLLYVVC